MMLLLLGLDEHGPKRESVSILVGPNGSGKSLLLRDIASNYRDFRAITVVCNTPHDRFAGLKGVKRVSIGRSDQSPRAIVKSAVGASIDADDSRFFQISSTLEYCGYQPRFGFLVEPSRRYGMSPEEARHALDVTHPDRGLKRRGSADDFYRAVAYLQRHDPYEHIWIDTNRSAYEFSKGRDFAAVLRCESQLRKHEVIRGVRVYLERVRGQAIEIQHASSGQLALISSLLFMITSAGNDPIIIVDEPENSLHPSWQREYVDKLLAAMTYRNATVIMATHAPLVVTGALTDNPELVTVFEVRDGRPSRLPIDAVNSPASSIEEILWRAFDVVTPANHFVSEQIVAAVSRFEVGEIRKEQVLDLVDRMDGESFDPRQKRFFGAVRDLVDKVEAARNENGGRDG